mmetsp:Transcript_68800/g.114352  ORF Transcript_68800/g.114352 Transcript_68800/m.114352 type:complete len:93 (+) Transcript_68800:241-519(+)
MALCATTLLALHVWTLFAASTTCRSCHRSLGSISSSHGAPVDSMGSPGPAVNVLYSSHIAANNKFVSWYRRINNKKLSAEKLMLVVQKANVL